MVEWDRGFTSSSPEYQQLVLDEDIEQFRSEKIAQNTKSPEEIQKLSVDENLSPLDRAVLLITTGQDIQKLCVVEQLTNLLQIDQMDTLSRVIPKVCSLLPGANEEFQQSASKAFAAIIQDGLVPIHIYITTCLPSMLKQLESRDTTTSNLWLDTVLATIPHLPKEVIKKQILSIAEANAQLSMSVSSRRGTCKLIGAMASKFDSFWVKKELCPLAKSLCLDVNSGVRMVMCEQLNLVIRALGLDIAKTTLFPQLIELTNDEEPSVKSAAIEALLDLVTFLDKSTVKEEVVPIMKRACEWACGSEESEAVLSIARLLGRICHELKDCLSSEQRLWFKDYYCKLVGFKFCSERRSSLTDPDPDQDSEEECHRWCAYNLPAMVLFCGIDSFEKDLFPSVKKLAESPHISVRRTLACGIHEIVEILGNTDRLKLAPVYQTLLKDSSGEVLFALINHLQESLTAFAKASNLSHETRQPGLLDFISPLLSCEQQASTLRQWRVHKALLSSMECLVHCMTSDQLYHKFTPVLFNYITGTCVLPVKLAASRTLCVFIRHLRKQEYRQELCLRLCEECAQHTAFKQRLLYVDVCGYILDIFSRSFFKEHFFQPLLELANDPIVNVRLHLCRLLPSLKSILKLPGDRVLLQKLEQTVRKLISQERDPDASRAIRDAVTEMDRIEVAMETLTRRTFFEADLTDQRREEEEKALLLSEAKECEKATKKLKGGKSPNESRKGSSLSLNSMSGGTSPSPVTRGKSSRGSQSLVAKSMSAPSPPTPPNETTPNQTNLLVSRKSPSISTSHQSSSPSVLHKARGTQGSKGSQSSVAATSSKVSVNKSKDSVPGAAKSAQRKNSKVQQYGLEYSKGKKRT